MNYIISAATLLLVIILFVRTVLPRSTVPMTLAEEIDPKTIEFQLTVLSMNSSDYRRRGGGLAVRRPIGEIRRFLKKTEKKLKSGKRLENYEYTIYKNAENIYKAVDTVEKQSPLFFNLPHCGNYPRLYELCSLAVRSNAGYVDIEMLPSAINIFNEHSPLLYAEIIALKAMISFCVLEQIAALCAKSEALSKIISRAEYDAERERIDLTSLKRNAYVFHYCERIDGSIARRFSAICAENGIDVWARCKDFEAELSNYALIASGATQSLMQISERLTDDLRNKLYSGYNYFSAAYGNDFERLSATEQSVRLNAFSVYCRRKKTDEISAIKKVNRADARAVTDRVSPSTAALVLSLCFALIIGLLPIFVTLAFSRIAALPCAVLSLPIALSAAFVILRFMAVSTFEKLKLSAAKAVGHRERKAEFASDYALPAPRRKIDSEHTPVTFSARINIFYNIVSKLNSAVSIVAPPCALILVFLSPLYSPLWLLGAFSREIVCFLFELRAAFTSEQAVFSKIASALYFACELPSKAVKVFFSGKKKMPKQLGITAQLAAAVGLFAIALFAEYAALYYVLAAAFASVPLVSYTRQNIAIQKRTRKTKPLLPPIDKEKTYENRGTYPRLRFIIGDRYFATISDGGDVFDFFDGSPLFEKMKLYLLKNGSRIPLDIVPPFKVSRGKAINEAVADGERFTVTTSAGKDGKKITVDSKSGGDFTLLIAHSLADDSTIDDSKCELPNCNCAAIRQKAENSPRYVCAAVRNTVPIKAVADDGEFAYGVKNGLTTVFAVRVKSENGRAETVFAAGYDFDRTAKNASCVFKTGFDDRAEAKAAAQSEFLKYPFDIAQTASFILYGRCMYSDSELNKIIDLNSNTLLCYQRSGGGLSRLHGKLKGLSELKKTGMKFNVAVACFDDSGSVKSTRNKVDLMFEEFSLDRRGRAVCVDCEGNERLFRALKYAAPDIDSLHFTAHTFDPELKVCKKAGAKLQYPCANIKGEGVAITENGDGIYDGFGMLGGAENRLFNALGMCCLKRADGSGFTFLKNPWDGKITEEKSVLDNIPNEFVAFSENGRLWSAAALPLGVKGESYCRHAKNFTEYVCASNGLNIRQTEFVSETERAKIWSILLENPRKSARKICVTACVRPTLGESFRTGKNSIFLSDTVQGVCALNKQTNLKAYLETDAETITRSHTLDSIIGENGRICRLSEIKTGGIVPAMIVCAEIKLPPLSSKKVRFSLSVGESANFEKSNLPARKNVSPFTFSTGTFDDDIFVNSLPYGVLSSVMCKPVFRGGEFCEGEHYASPLLKGACLPANHKDVFKKIITDACAKRFACGDIVLFARGSGGKRAARHSASLFLPLAVSRYIDVTDERDLLFERSGYADMGDGEKASVLEHCLQAIETCCGADTADCFGIDAELLLISAIAAIVPLVKDSETRLKLSDEKLKAEKRLEKIDIDLLTTESLCWLVFCGIGKRVTSERLLNRLNEKSDNVNMKKLWVCAALVKIGDTESAYKVYQSLNPLKKDPPLGYISDNGLSSSSDESEALAYIIASELFFGCRIMGDSLVLNPHLPQGIKRAEVKFDCENINFDIEIDNTGTGNWRVCLDGISYNCDSVPIDRKTSGKKIVLKRR